MQHIRFLSYKFFNLAGSPLPISISYKAPKINPNLHCRILRLLRMAIQNDRRIMEHFNVVQSIVKTFKIDEVINPVRRHVKYRQIHRVYEKITITIHNY